VAHRETFVAAVQLHGQVVALSLLGDRLQKVVPGKGLAEGEIDGRLGGLLAGGPLLHGVDDARGRQPQVAAHVADPVGHGLVVTQQPRHARVRDEALGRLDKDVVEHGVPHQPPQVHGPDPEPVGRHHLVRQLVEQDGPLERHELGHPELPHGLQGEVIHELVC